MIKNYLKVAWRNIIKYRFYSLVNIVGLFTGITKEIGIRKILGASVLSVISLFMKDFLWIILIACAIACPVAWFIMHGWLSDYAYRITLTATPFIISVSGLALITAILITIQTIKAGTANPVESLRTE